jgi:hypothetical protein
MISFQDKIPGHPRSCKGVKHYVYSADQCRMCWLAVYNSRYRQMWNITLPAETNRPSPPEDYYACVHRGVEKIQAPGCGGCSGISHINTCSSPQLGPGHCVIDILGKGSQTARSRGYRMCAECGYREPEKDLEMPVARFMELLEQPPSTMPLGWQHWRVTHAAYKSAFREKCDTAPSSPRKKLNGRGIVIGAGGEIYFKCALASVAALRASGCFLPVQFWYLGKEEMDPHMVNYARSIGIECVDAHMVASRLEKKPRILGGWELKAFAILHSPFEEVLYLDADCIVTRDPTFLFSCEQYLEHGAIFWPDVPSREPPVDPQLWEWHGLFPDGGADFETGQFIVNKGRCWRELEVSLWVNEHSDWYYRHMYGDKTTFRLAWKGCGTTFALAPLATYRSPAIEQYDFDHRVLFQHCCQGKANLSEGHPIHILKYQEAAVEGFKAWKQHWNGKLYYPTYPAIEGQYRLNPTSTVIDFKKCGATDGTMTWGTYNDELVLIGRGRLYPGEPVSWRHGVLDFLKKEGDRWVGPKFSLTPIDQS